jgi:hypothetical protein
MRQRRAAGVLLPIVALAVLVAAVPGCTEAPTRTETFTIGTFNLAPLGTSGSESESFSISVPRPAPDRGIMVKRMRFFLADAGGRELDLEHDGIHLHHVVMMSSKARDSACPESGYPAIGGQRFAAAGNEKSPILFLPGAAYHARAGDSWRAIWHLMNMGATRLDGVRLAYEIVYHEGVPDATTRDVKPHYLDVAGCGSSDFDLAGGGAPGSTATRSVTVALADEGRGVYSIGHLHDGGIDVTLTDPTGQIRCTATARYGEGDGGPGHEHGHGTTGHIASIDVCPAPFAVAPGSWTVSARYPGDVAFKDVMGVIFLYVTI